MNELKKRLDDAKKKWTKELSHVLWTYRTTPRRSTGEKHFSMTYGAKAVNKVIVNGVKKILDDVKGKWVEELSHVLWTYRTMPHRSTGEIDRKSVV